MGKRVEGSPSHQPGQPAVQTRASQSLENAKRKVKAVAGKATITTQASGKAIKASANAPTGLVDKVKGLFRKYASIA
jgi:hypothetical protein